MALENYVPVMLRLKQFRADNKDTTVMIDIEPNVSWEKEAVYFKATIKVGDKVVAVGHSLAASIGDEKEFEKAETGAVGRALAFLGYGADDEESAGTSGKSEKKTGKSGLGGGLGKKTSAKVAEATEEVDKDAEEETETQVTAPVTKTTAPKLGLKKAAPKVEVAEEESEGDVDADADESGDDDEAEVTQAAASAVKASSASASKLGNVMAKYGLAKK